MKENEEELLQKLHKSARREPLKSFFKDHREAIAYQLMNVDAAKKGRR
jgi:hypothetical protein